MRRALAARVLGVAAVAAVALTGLTGCGSDDGGDGGEGGDGGTSEAARQSPEAADEDPAGDAAGDQPEEDEAAGAGEDTGAGEEQEAAASGMDGSWVSIVDGNDIETITVTGGEVSTTGPLSCPGTLSEAGGTTRVELACDPEDPARSAGDVELSEDGSHLVISWDGEAWGGMVDSFTRE
ncbi:hypothetical protein ACTWP5_21985 [Streptomyces sp. 4N509B]|uniref:hypothetical protein n=1 Tax=Streptomyces sp. 4N509B TaxID=3457413 RepID=UPI003FD49C1B